VVLLKLVLDCKFYRLNSRERDLFERKAHGEAQIVALASETRVVRLAQGELCVCVCVCVCERESLCVHTVNFGARNARRTLGAG